MCCQVGRSTMIESLDMQNPACRCDTARNHIGQIATRRIAGHPAESTRPLSRGCGGAPRHAKGCLRSTCDDVRRMMQSFTYAFVPCPVTAPVAGIFEALKKIFQNTKECYPQSAFSSCMWEFRYVWQSSERAGKAKRSKSMKRRSRHHRDADRDSARNDHSDPENRATLIKWACENVQHERAFIC